LLSKKRRVEMRQKTIIVIGCLLAISLITADSFAGGKNYRVTITNITAGQTFTPIMIAAHKRGVKLFTPGSPASAELAMLAEGGDTAPLTESLLMNPDVGHVMTTGGPLGPGETVVVEIPGHRRFGYISLAAMLLPTNDGFIALNGVTAPGGHRTAMYLSPGYDAGSELNDESCENIPGPFVCGGTGEGYSTDDGEGYVHIHSGIHGIDEIDPAVYDWKNPAARIVIQKSH
jgi:hypothetical protein